MGREQKRVLKVDESALKAHERAGQRQAVSWNLSQQAADMRRDLTTLDQMIQWSARRYNLTGYEPPKSNYYFPELAQVKGIIESTHYPFERDATKLFHLFSEGTRKECMTQVSWRVDCGPKAVAVLHLAGIHAPKIVGERPLDSHIRDKEADYFTLRFDTHAARRLDDFGDCCRLMLFD